MDDMSQLVEHLETFSRAHSVTASHDDGSTLQVVLGSLYMAVEHLRDVFRLRHELGYILDDDFSLVVGVEHLGLHHTRADRRHLGTILWIDNRGNNVSAKRRADLIEQILVSLAVLLVLVIADFQGSAVGGQTAVQGRADARTQIAAHHIGTHQTDLWLLLLEEIDQNGGVGL